LEQAYDPRVSPILYSLSDLQGCAPAYVVTAGCDMLRDEGREYAKKLEKAGVNVRFREYHTIHAFLSMHFADYYKEAIQDLAGVLSSAFGTKASL
jgi:acetyl esterase